MTGTAKSIPAGTKALREKLGLPTEDDAPEDGPPAEEDDEVRTLAVSYDDQDVRYKQWRDACAQSRVHQYPDFPLDGPVTALDLSKHMQRFGGDPANWMLQFCREKRIAPTDRWSFSNSKSARVERLR